jgi:hypothetical protein
MTPHSVPRLARALSGLALLSVSISCSPSGSLSFASISGLRWNTQHAAIRLRPGVTTEEVVFPFRNAASQAITISRVEADCDCLVSSGWPRTIAPGEASAVTIQFTVGERTGEQLRTIRVFTAAEPTKPELLRLTVDVPETLTLNTRQLEWKVGAPPAPLTIGVEVHGDPIKIVRAVSSNSTFSPAVKVLNEGRKYTIEVTPKDTAGARSSELLIETDFPTAPWNRFTVKLHVR